MYLVVTLLIVVVFSMTILGGLTSALPGVDVETVALHENGHSLGVGHFAPPPRCGNESGLRGNRQNCSLRRITLECVPCYLPGLNKFFGWDQATLFKLKRVRDGRLLLFFWSTSPAR